MTNVCFLSNGVNLFLGSEYMSHEFVPPIFALTFSNLTHVNRYVHKQPCNIEGAETLHKFLPGSKYLFGFDLKAGYHHVDIQPHQHTLLGFAFNDYKGLERFFVFKVMLFGLSSDGFVFTNLLRVLIKHWRTHSNKDLRLQHGKQVTKRFIICRLCSQQGEGSVPGRINV